MSGEDEARREHREWLLRLSADVQAQWLGFLEETRSKEGLSVDHPLVQMQLHDAFVRRMGEASAADGTVDRRGDQRKKRASSADGDDGDGGGKLGFGDALVSYSSRLETPQSARCADRVSQVGLSPMGETYLVSPIERQHEG